MSASIDEMLNAFTEAEILHLQAKIDEALMELDRTVAHKLTIEHFLFVKLLIKFYRQKTGQTENVLTYTAPKSTAILLDVCQP